MSYNLEAEQAILGSIILNNAYFYRASILMSDDFGKDIHKKLFEYFINNIDVQNQNKITLQEFFKANEMPEYLSVLLASAEMFCFSDYVMTVKTLSNKRKVKEFYQNSLKDIETKSIDQLETESFKFFDGLSQINKQFETRHIKDIAGELICEIETKKEDKRVKIDIPMFDRKIGGFNAGNLIIIGGRTGMGKSAFAGHLLLRSSYEGAIVMFQLEMTDKEIVKRLISQDTQIDTNLINSYNIPSNDYLNEIKGSAIRLSNKSIFIDQTPNITIAKIKTKLNKLASKVKIGMVIVDYIQKIGRAKGSIAQNMHQHIGEVSGELKELAKEYDIPVVALAQLNRAVTTRNDPRPTISDLKESGNIEQDADLIILLHREEYYLQQQKPSSTSPLYEQEEFKRKLQTVKNKMDLIVGKNRHGSTMSVNLFFDSQYSKFMELTTDETY